MNKKFVRTIVIEGHPIPKERHRSYLLSGRYIRTYDPQSDVKTAVSFDMRRQLDTPFQGFHSLYVKFFFYMPVPASLTSVKKNLLLWFQDHCSKPDLDNLIKFYLDCGNGILWKDDSIISKIRLQKMYSEKPKTVIKIVGVQKMQRQEIAEDVLRLFSPEEFAAMLQEMKHLSDQIEAQKAISHPKNYAKNASTLILYFASKYARRLHKIMKDYADYADQLQTCDNVTKFVEDKEIASQKKIKKSYEI